MESTSLVFKTSNTKRFVIEDSITKVTSDGEPHEMMTMIAGLSGLIAAIAILTVLIFLVACKKSNRHECDKCSEIGSATGISTGTADTQSKSSPTPIAFNSKRVEARSISVICDRDEVLECHNIKSNFQNNLNKAFESSELDLQNALKTPKQKKKTRWQDEVEMQRETSIEIERY